MGKMTLKLPKLAVSMQEGTVVEWLVTAGTEVVVGQPLYVVESEKTSTEIESPFAGAFNPLVETGTPLKVGTPIAEIST